MVKGKIIKGIAGFYYIHTGEQGLYECKAKGVFRNKKIKPLVGDKVEIDVLNEMLAEMKKPGFDIIWRNTLYNIKTNSKRWRENHSKKCQVHLLAKWLILQSETHKTGERDFYSEDNINKIKTVLEEYNEIYDFR